MTNQLAVKSIEDKLFRSLIYCWRVCRPHDVFLDVALLRSTDSLVATEPQRIRKALYRFCESKIVEAIQKLS